MSRVQKMAFHISVNFGHLQSLRTDCEPNSYFLQILKFS